MLTDDDIREALRSCRTALNPWGKPVDVVALGLVERIALALDPEAPGAGISGVPPRYSLRVELLEPPGADEDAAAQLGALVRNRLAGIEGLWQIYVVFVPTPRWTAQRLSGDARRELGLDFPILNQPRRTTR